MKNDGGSKRKGTAIQGKNKIPEATDVTRNGGETILAIRCDTWGMSIRHVLPLLLS